MSTTSPAPYVPYQAYKSKRHSRVISSPPAEPNGTASSPSHSAHLSSSSIELGPKVNGEVNVKSSINWKDDVALPRDHSTAAARSSSRPASVMILPQQQRSASSSISSEQTSPSSPGAPSIVSSATGIWLNGEPLVDPHSPSEPSSPVSSQSAPSAAPKAETNGKVPYSSSYTFPSEKAAGKAPAAAPEAGPLSAKPPAFHPRRSSTFRYVSLRPNAKVGPGSGTGMGSTPRTSSPLRPATHLHNRTVSLSSPLSATRQLGEGDSSASRPQAAAGGTASPASVHSELMLDTAQSSGGLLNPAIPNTHHRGTSMTMPPPLAKFMPPQRTSSLPPPPVPPPKASSPSPTPASASISANSSRVTSPLPQSTPSTSTSTSTPTSVSGTTTATVTYKTVYRPGFQPNGRYRPLTDDFLALRKRARDKGRIELTRLERRFEKLVELHFSPTSNESLGESSMKQKEKSVLGPGSAPPLARRASSFFEELGDLKGKSASELWRSVLESRIAAANGGKGDIRAAEQRITPWQDDAEVSTCPHCAASFHPLTNRKHHCRLCGRIVCSLPVKNPQRPVPCSLLFISDPKTGRIEEVTEGVDYGVKPRARTDSKANKNGMKGESNEEKFLKGVRICRECKPVMLRRQYLQEAKRIPVMARLYEALISLESEIEEELPHFQELMLSLANNSNEAPSKEASAARKHLLQCFAEYDAIAKRIRKIPCPGGPGGSQDRVQAAIQARATMFLQKNMFPLQSLPKPRKRGSSGTVGTATGDVTDGGEDIPSAVIDPDSELARALQPLLEQEALLESFVEEATVHRKFEDARTLKANLGEIRAEIDRIVVNADRGVV